MVRRQFLLALVSVLSTCDSGKASKVPVLIEGDANDPALSAALRDRLKSGACAQGVCYEFAVTTRLNGYRDKEDVIMKVSLQTPMPDGRRVVTCEMFAPEYGKVARRVRNFGRISPGRSDGEPMSVAAQAEQIARSLVICAAK